HSTGRATPPPVAPSAAAPPSELPPPSAAIPAASTPTTLPTAAPSPAALSAPAAPAPVAPTSADLRAEDFVAADRMWFPPEGSSCTPPHNTLPFTWRDYAPKAFSELRAMFGIDPADYTLSLCGDNALRELSSPGKSGSVFYLSDDDRFIIKTMRASEVRVLQRMLPDYFRHVRDCEHTLITKFFGLHSIRVYNTKQPSNLSRSSSTSNKLSPSSSVASTTTTNTTTTSTTTTSNTNTNTTTTSTTNTNSTATAATTSAAAFAATAAGSPLSDIPSSPEVTLRCSRTLFPPSPFASATQNATTNTPRTSTTVNPATTTTSSTTASASHPSVPTNQQQQQQHQHPDPHQQHNHPQRYRRRRRLHTVLSSPSTLIRFVVMANVFVTDLRMHRRFDLKGSSQGRSTEKVAVDETTTLKDLDLDLSFHMPASWRALMHRQIALDTTFLQRQRIMDYSLLLGVHFRPTNAALPPVTIAEGRATQDGQSRPSISAGAVVVDSIGAAESVLWKKKKNGFY
ncbi:unnamed protein product, partial [Closterium sp. NIES-54]